MAYIALTSALFAPNGHAGTVVVTDRPLPVEAGAALAGRPPVLRVLQIPLTAPPDVEGTTWQVCNGEAIQEEWLLEEFTKARDLSRVLGEDGPARVRAEHALAQVPCLRDALNADTAAALYLLAGQMAFATADTSAADRLFGAAISLAPNYPWDASFAEAQGEGRWRALHEAAALAPMGAISSAPGTAEVLVDGRPIVAGKAEATAGAHLVQVPGVPGAAWMSVESGRTVAVRVPSRLTAESLAQVDDPLVGPGVTSVLLSVTQPDEELWVAGGGRLLRRESGDWEEVRTRPAKLPRVIAVSGGVVLAGGATLGLLNLEAQRQLVLDCAADVADHTDPGAREICLANEAAFDTAVRSAPLPWTVAGLGGATLLAAFVLPAVGVHFTW